MLWSPVLLAGLLGLTTAHGHDGDYPVPQLVGGRQFLSELKADRGMADRKLAAAHRVVDRHAAQRAATARTSARQSKDQHHLDSRQGGRNREGACGAKAGSCARGYCCSAEGYVATHGANLGELDS